MRGPGRVGPDQDGVEHQGGVVAFFVAERVRRGHGADGALEEFEVVVGVVGGGVARSQHGGQGFFGVVAPHGDGVEPEAVFVGGRGVLLFRVHVEQGRVEVPDHRADRRPRRPDARSGGGQGHGDRPQLGRSRGVQGPPGRRHRGHRAEELLLFFERREVGQAVRPVRDGDAEMSEHDAGIVGVPVDPALGHGLRHGLGQPGCDRPVRPAVQRRHGSPSSCRRVSLWRDGPIDYGALSRSPPVLVRMCVVATNILPGGRAFYADACTARSGAARIIEARLNSVNRVLSIAPKIGAEP